MSIGNRLKHGFQKWKGILEMNRGKLVAEKYNYHYADLQFKQCGRPKICDGVHNASEGNESDTESIAKKKLIMHTISHQDT